MPPTGKRSYNVNGNTLYPVIMALPSTQLPYIPDRTEQCVGKGRSTNGVRNYNERTNNKNKH
jgi:hypothetical protein